MTIVAMLSKQGTACAETALHSREDSPQARKVLEDQFCHGNTDDPVAGSWADVSDNEAIAELFDEATEEQEIAAFELVKAIAALKMYGTELDPGTVDPYDAEECVNNLIENARAILVDCKETA